MSRGCWEKWILLHVDSAWTFQMCCYNFYKRCLMRWCNICLEMSYYCHGKTDAEKVVVVLSNPIIEGIRLSFRSHPWTHNNLDFSKFHFGMSKNSAKWSVIMCELEIEEVSNSKELFFRQIKMFVTFSLYQVWLFEIQISISVCDSVDPWTQLKA